MSTYRKHLFFTKNTVFTASICLNVSVSKQDSAICCIFHSAQQVSTSTCRPLQGLIPTPHHSSHRATTTGSCRLAMQSPDADSCRCSCRGCSCCGLLPRRVPEALHRGRSGGGSAPGPGRRRSGPTRGADGRGAAAGRQALQTGGLQRGGQRQGAVRASSSRCPAAAVSGWKGCYGRDV